ncbi:MAG: hypothetical protein HAW66_01630 [Shewanella sp.]|nr:hypothetical protein [Shewanella sp.]
MIKPIDGVVWCLIIFCFSFTTVAKEQQSTFSVDKIVVVNHTIFDESAENTIFIHRWADELHKTTRKSVILERLNFHEGAIIDVKDIDEAQRLLRAQPYLRDAKVYIAQADPISDVSSNGKTIVVETWDNWSLLPTVNYGHSNGDSKYAIGVKEDNLLGLGIGTRVNYQSNKDRSGYQFSITAPLKLIKHANISADFYNNDDGKRIEFNFEKPFYTLDTRFAYSTHYLTDQRVDNLRQNGQIIEQYEHDIQFINLQFGWLSTQTSNSIARFSLGITKEQHDFDSLPNTLPLTSKPRNRDYLYTWFGYEYLQDNFQVLTNIRLINQKEDVNLGWYHSLRFGVETEDRRSANKPGYQLSWLTTKGYRWGKHLWLFNAKGKATLETRLPNYYKINIQAEYFYHIAPKWTSYNKLRLVQSKNLPLDLSNTLGDDNGLRGYPDQYQHGDTSWLATTELRYVPDINLYQLADLGWVLFTDLGHASGGRAKLNEENNIIGSIGIGARLYSSKSSYGSVAHIDLTYPFTQGTDVGGFEWRFQVKSHF